MRHRKKHRNRRNRRSILLLWILAAVLCVGRAIPFALSHWGGEGADIVRRDDVINSRMRVLLRSLGQQEALTITCEGNYAIESDPGFRFAQGVTLHFTSSEQTLWLECGGLTLDMGKKCTLTRHVSAGENGLIIAETGSSNLYCGDLTLEATDVGITAMLEIALEDYLYGVVPYEMSDSWPIEALKAQAVAARTYALRKKDGRTGAAYDVTDTTTDQVFKGLNAADIHAMEAVDGTSGVVGLYKGQFAECYYTASNGGQTAMPDEIWGNSGDYGHLSVRDDPYDIENPLSILRTMTISTEGTKVDASLLSLFLEKTAAELNPEEYSTDMQDIRIVRIMNMLPENPKGNPESRMMQSLRCDLLVEARKWNKSDSASPSAPYAEPRLGEFAPLPQPLQISIPLYDGLKDMYPTLQINSGDVELYSVIACYEDGREEPLTPYNHNEESTQRGEREYPVEFRIEARRFGHGVGMSQRGAQRMAGVHDLLYTDILSFYYPGMELVRFDTEPAPLTDLGQLPKGVGARRITSPLPSPTPAPLPPLQSGETLGVVQLDASDSALNVRQSPSTGSAILATLLHGQPVIVCEPLEDWYRIRTAEIEGYVYSAYLLVE